jgi:hypothetical protein
MLIPSAVFEQREVRAAAHILVHPLEAQVSDTEPVLDVPAISYAEVEQQQRERAEAVKTPPKRRASKKTASKRQKVAPKASTARPSPKRGEVGPAVVAAVDAKLAEGLNASQAFEVVGKERAMKAGAVSANYYRVKRNQSKVTKTSSATKRSAPRRGAKERSPRPVASGGAGSRSVASGGMAEVERVLADLSRGVQALSDVVQQQGTEVAELRSRLGQVGSALGG